MPLLQQLASLVLLATSGAAPVPCQSKVMRRAKPMMATYVSITARGCDAQALEEGVRAAFDEMQRLADLLSEWNPRSPVSQVSDQAGLAPVSIPRQVFDVLDASQQAASLTGGAFDVTWAALAGLWHFDGPPALPDREAVRLKLQLVDHRDLVLDPAGPTAFLKRKGMRLGLGGVAKGYIAAAGADLLVEHGIRDVLVAASGDVAARGSNGAAPWWVAIQDPRHSDRALARIALRDESISTAGDYERCFFLGGRRYHHILDPKTGYPTSGTASVSVVSRSGVLADALDTGLLVMGTEQGSKVVERLPALGVLFVDESGRLHRAGALGSRFEIGSQSSPIRPDARGEENQASAAPLD